MTPTPTPGATFNYGTPPSIRDGNLVLPSGDGRHGESQQDEQLAMAALSASLQKLFTSLEPTVGISGAGAAAAAGGGGGGGGMNGGAVGTHYFASPLASTLESSRNNASPLASTLESSRNISRVFDDALRTPQDSPLRPPQAGGAGGR